MTLKIPEDSNKAFPCPAAPGPADGGALLPTLAVHLLQAEFIGLEPNELVFIRVILSERVGFAPGLSSRLSRLKVDMRRLFKIRPPRNLGR